MPCGWRLILLERSDSHGSAEVAIDGAMVRIGDNEIFLIEAFMTHECWEQTDQIGRNAWQGSYEKGGSRLAIHARSGVGDVVALVGSGRIRAECKGGPLVVKAGSPEYPRLRETLGQLLTVERVEVGDVMVAVVPRTDRFLRLARNWQPRPLLARSGVRILLVGRNGTVARDAAQEEAMEDLGYMVIRFGHQDDWTATVAEYPYVFGSEG